MTMRFQTIHHIVILLIVVVETSGIYHSPNYTCEQYYQYIRTATVSRKQIAHKRINYCETIFHNTNTTRPVDYYKINICRKWILRGNGNGSWNMVGNGFFRGMPQRCWKDLIRWLGHQPGKSGAAIRNKRQGLLSGQYPNTHFCGKGDLFIKRNLLGSDPADLCCREHDSCLVYVSGGETYYDYNNPNYLVQTNCQCDKKFYWCLERIAEIFGEETDALTIRSIFFNTLNMECFMFRKGYTCLKAEKKCEGWIWQDCVDVCLDRVYNNLQAQKGQIYNSEIHIIDQTETGL